MVRNTHGGNKSKGMARKNMVDNNEKRKLRLSSGELEKYAVVTRLLGHGMFYTTTNEGEELLGRIRNKFKGRSRRGNDLSMGTMVLIGLREWEAPNFKECDLLEVYDANEVKQIRQISSIDTRLINNYLDNPQGGGASGSVSEEINDGGITFSTDTGVDYFADVMPETQSGSGEKVSFADEEINIDDI
jgi:translation initiation factor IF-1